MFPARKNKNTRVQNRPMVFAAVASANAERDSLFRLTNQLEEVHSIAPSPNPTRNTGVRSTPRASKALVDATQSLAMNK